MRQNSGEKLKNGITILALAATFLMSQKAEAIQIELASSINPVGSGARATGMGGAFIAVADDATAASWNPAGLVHLEKPELSLVYGYTKRIQTYHDALSLQPKLNGNESSIDVNDINFASIAYPFQLFKRNMIVTLSYQRLYELNKQYSMSGYVPEGQNPLPPDNDNLKQDIKFSQKGYLSAISPSIAIQVTPELYFGATVNIWDDFAGTSNWKSSHQDISTGTLNGNTLPPTSWDQKTTFSGLNANLGLIYSLKGKYNFGFVYKTPFNADLDYTDSFNGTINSEKYKLSMPASYGFGFSYRYSDSLTMALDVYRTEWSDFVLTDSAGAKLHPFTGISMNYGGKLEDTTQVRIGGEYLIIGDKITVPIRAGFFYDPEPGITRSGSDAIGNALYKSHIDDFFGFSLGTGISINKYSFDVSYQYRWGNRITGDIPYAGVTADIDQHTVMSSLIYHF